MPPILNVLATDATDARPASAGPAHLGVGALLQPPLLPLSLQPLELFPDFGWRSPPFHNLRAVRRRRQLRTQRARKHTPRVDIVNCWRVRVAQVWPFPSRDSKSGSDTLTSLSPTDPGPGEARLLVVATQLCPPTIPEAVLSLSSPERRKHGFLRPSNFSMRLQESYKEHVTLSRVV